MIKEYETRTTQMIVAPKGEPIFSDLATVVTIVDEGGGEFVSITQHGKENVTIFITPEEWPILRGTIDWLIDECRKDDVPG